MLSLLSNDDDDDNLLFIRSRTEATDSRWYTCEVYLGIIGVHVRRALSERRSERD